MAQEEPSLGEMGYPKGEQCPQWLYCSVLCRESLCSLRCRRDDRSGFCFIFSLAAGYDDPVLTSHIGVKVVLRRPRKTLNVICNRNLNKSS